MEFDCLGEKSPEIRTVGFDRHFNMESRSYLQSQVMVGNSIKCSDALVCIVVGSWKGNVIGSEDGDWCISVRFVSEGRSRLY